jgi:hypothetical protein
MAKTKKDFSKQEAENRFLAALRGAFGKTKPKAKSKTNRKKPAK